MAYITDAAATELTDTWVEGLVGKGIISNLSTAAVLWRADNSLPEATDEGALVGEAIENNLATTTIYLKAPKGKTVEVLITRDVP